jgi:hypothetical protein
MSGYVPGALALIIKDIVCPDYNVGRQVRLIAEIPPGRLIRIEKATFLNSNTHPAWAVMAIDGTLRTLGPFLVPTETTTGLFLRDWLMPLDDGLETEGALSLDAQQGVK